MRQCAHLLALHAQDSPRKRAQKSLTAAKMVPKSVLLSFLPLATSATFLLPRNYEDEVCHPAVKESSDIIPPCISVESIEAMCAPKKPEPIYYAASQQCMCKGSYFSDWPGCQSCLFEHGLRSERDMLQYNSILSAASSAFCDPNTTPTAAFAKYWTSASYTVPVPTTGATGKSDRAPGETAVSLYYTASGSQGPGTVTGSAANVVSTQVTQAQTDSKTGSGAGTTGAIGSGSNTSSSSGAGTTAETTAETTSAPSGTGRPASTSSTASTSTTTSGNAGLRVTGMPTLGHALLWGVCVGAVLVL